MCDLGAQKNCLTEMALLSIHMIWLGYKKIFNNAFLSGGQSVGRLLNIRPRSDESTPGVI